ncbi:DHBP synthase RibB-like alpha/beta domain-containing protein [Cladochytrium replicatum]|nr:DHBP synthase RibB-like alpha/beta domain-containing protein [Cladochytrium replicatum]
MVLDRYYSRSLKKNSAALDGANGVGTSEFDKIEDAVAEYEKGNFVIAVDNEDRENEGDLLIAAEDMTPEKMAFMIRYTSGVICVSTAGDRLDELDLPLMVERNTESLKTAYTITVDYKHGTYHLWISYCPFYIPLLPSPGTTTGISAADRSSTVRALADPSVQADDFSRPGHVFPLRYNPGGVLARVGHTEAGVDLAKLAGKKPCAALSEIVLDDGRMARRDDLRVLAKQWGLKMITIKDLIEYRVRMGLTDPKW